MPPPSTTTGARSLSLHVSALNDTEYDYFTASFSDLLDDPDAFPTDDSRYDQATISTRETRAWLRGRYSSVSLPELDTILRTITPNSNDVLTGGQFFAVMRLITHVAAGKEIDGSLVFTQSHPIDDSPRSKSHKLPPPPPHHPAHDGKKGAAPPPPPAKRPPPAPRPTNHTVLPEKEKDKSAPAIAELVIPAFSPPPGPPPKPTNPFVNRTKSHDVSAGMPPMAPRAKTTGTIEGKQPPLPPRKPAIPPPPPPRHVSSSFVPPPFPSSGSTNVLIQQSLQAGRIAQSLKKAEEKLQRERVLEVLKTSSAKQAPRNRSTSPSKDASSGASASSSAGSSYGSATRPPPVLPPRRAFSPETSPRMSIRSLDQVATASVGTYKPRYPTSSPFARDSSAERTRPPLPLRSPSRSPSKYTADLPLESPTSTISQPPPTHPDRKPVNSSFSQEWSDVENPPSPGARLFRSNSLHHPPPPTPPPSFRKRPESVQIAPFDSVPPSVATSPIRPSTSNRQTTLSRHVSLSTPGHLRSGSRSSDRAPSSLSDSPMANLQKAFGNLHQKAQPKLDAARFKAEAGLSKRGFVPHHSTWMRSEGEERLIDEPEEIDIGGNRSRDDLDLSDGSEAEREREREHSWEARLRSLRGSQSHTGHLSSGHEARERAARTKDKEGSNVSGNGFGSSGAELGVLGGGVKDRAWLFERDDMKWPAGEGWKPL
ncbi:hypothetical protein EIP91_004358 [Steccherinum ochraceum]|uniref:EH domain-containing protein n=1 Tax=Steccherinum ochraceum TaxID=92696 RepID=A0A4R0RC06_9APHY|nr:hypothetical protein EIP91_004358 [Steccherinum ochraceum]